MSTNLVTFRGARGAIAVLWYTCVMLRWIRVQNIAVIDRLEVDFEPGLNLITGETGAGKSILIDALGLVLGSRASTEMLRTGEDTAVVEAGFEIDPMPEALVERLCEAGVEADEEIVIRREITASGRGKIVVNGTGSARALLRDIAVHLADIHGQGENSSLLRPEAGLELLDRTAGCGDLRTRVGDRFRDIRELESEMARVEQQAAERVSRREQLEFEFRELDKAHLRPGEDEELHDERRILAHAGKLKELADHVYATLYDDEHDVLSRIASAFRRVEELAGIDSKWHTYVEQKETLVGQIEDLALFSRDYAADIDVTPGRIDEVEARLSSLEGLKKRYGGTLDATIQRRDALGLELQELETSGLRVDEITKRLRAARDAYWENAQKLSRLRLTQAKKLEKTLAKELPTLALEKAHFSIRMETPQDIAEYDRFRESGLDSAEILFNANAGEEPKSLAKTASGGELSRFTLALKAVSAKGERAKTLVFDEVDAGIGGRVADAVGEKLEELAKLHQVICVTHLPQIASFASSHFKIVKLERKGRTETQIERLDSKGRVDEIARMLAGAVVTESAREHAKQLVATKSSK